MRDKPFSYKCPACGPFDATVAADTTQCRCGETAKRQYVFAVNRTSLKSEGRWDPVVGAYVENNRQFRSLLSQGIDEQSQKLNMDVKLQTVDARDTDALADLHGTSVEQRKADLEPKSLGMVDA